MWSKFKKICPDCLARFVPDTVKKKRNNAWITRDIIHVKRKLKQMWRSSRRPESVINLLNTELRDKIKQMKYRFFSVTLSNFLRRSLGKFWRFLSGTKSSSLSLIVDSSPLTDAKHIGGECNGYFQSVLVEKDAGLILEPEGYISSMADVVTQEGIFNEGLVARLGVEPCAAVRGELRSSPAFVHRPNAPQSRR